MRITGAALSDDLGALEKVVVHLQDRIIKGYLEPASGTTIEEILTHASARVSGSLRIRHKDSDRIEEIDTAAAKALFFVNKFESNPDRKDVHFSRLAPIVHGIWVRVQFMDGEVIEGIVNNTIDHIVNSGFFLRPTDPESNNRLIYMSKNQLRDYRVLGLRNR